jgi:hypothetical protein
MTFLFFSHSESDSSGEESFPCHSERSEESAFRDTSLRSVWQRVFQKSVGESSSFIFSGILSSASTVTC